MGVTKIPFVKKTGITKAKDGNLESAFSDETHNHLSSMHASAQFTLAETASGELLQTLFPELVNKVIPLLRDATVKFKKPAVKNLILSLLKKAVLQFLLRLKLKIQITQ